MEIIITLIKLWFFHLHSYKSLFKCFIITNYYLYFLNKYGSINSYSAPRFNLFLSYISRFFFSSVTNWNWINNSCFKSSTQECKWELMQWEFLPQLHTLKDSSTVQVDCEKGSVKMISKLQSVPVYNKKFDIWFDCSLHLLVN